MVYFRPSDSLTVRVARSTVVQTTSAEILLKNLTDKDHD